MKKILLTLIAGGMVFSALPSNAASVGGVLKSTGGVIVGAFYGGMLAGPMLKAVSGLDLYLMN